jgi:hypothetical protein
MKIWKLRLNGLFWVGYTSGKLDKNGKEFKSKESLLWSLKRLNETKPDLYQALLDQKAEIVQFEIKETETIELNENTINDI